METIGIIGIIGIIQGTVDWGLNGVNGKENGNFYHTLTYRV